GATLRGKVVDADDGEPLAGARVVLWSTGDWTDAASPDLIGIAISIERPLDETTSRDDGSFAMEHVPARTFNEYPGPTFMNGAAGVGYVAAIARGHAVAQEPVLLVGDGDTTDVVIRSWPTATVRGRVADAEGRPVSGAFVRTSADKRWPGAVPS